MESTTPPMLLVLDLMDTVVQDPFYTEVPRLLGVTTTEEVVDLLDPGQWIAFETGKIDEATYLGRMFKGGPPPEGPDPLDVKQAIVNGYCYLEGMESMLRELAATGPTKLWALSNYSPWLELLRQRLDLDRYFDDYVVSCVTGFRKPDPRAYEALLSRVKLAPELCLFVDDRQENVTAALRLGMQALLFRGAADLRAQLCARKLVLPV